MGTKRDGSVVRRARKAGGPLLGRGIWVTEGDAIQDHPEGVRLPHEHEAYYGINRTMALARETLGMDVVFVSESAGDRMEFRTLEGDAESFGLREGAGLPLGDTFCKQVVDGALPNVVPDARNDARVSGLVVTREAGIGAYVGVPLRFSDGRIYGTLCCLSHSPEPHLQERDARFVGMLARLVADQIEREEAEAERRRQEVRSAGVGALFAALEARDGYTGDHSRAVVRHSVAVARRMGLSEEEVAEVEQAALLHDVGKIGLGDAILSKPQRLTDAEGEMMRMHPVVGEQLVVSTEGLAHLAPAIRAGHERWDGAGYPDGLKGEEIPFASRIVLVCDAFHAMTSDRPYRRALDVRNALAEVEKNAGSQFCPRTVEAFLAVVGQGME